MPLLQGSAATAASSNGIMTLQGAAGWVKNCFGIETPFYDRALSIAYCESRITGR
ncbi:hypothetical protein F2S74_15480 [Pseudomonas syringae pv. actinidiae]|uniref:Phosphomannomutase n=1 Tax=Pseudomonas syringae pv. actinidiae TaxID=103796 RepID=A0A2V0QPS1_PSESF|nr:hypothetical protein [Pseudomonas syringae pv. actinidiae]NVL43491.1 hypothetical protein [Pseudomonas syringae pv. actinidiae]NVL47255.1 hypothetical protein [Pseudomonas syringae pv. actinidiae]GBH12235.1 Phosphomannomutase [Pseudomonas syringae pv. actinidiae]